MAAHYAVTLVHGPGWDASRRIRDQNAGNEHAAFTLAPQQGTNRGALTGLAGDAGVLRPTRTGQVIAVNGGNYLSPL
jgi:hypothetical protein